VGLEPTTYGLKVRYSAIELAPLAAKRSQLGGRVCNRFRSARASCYAAGWGRLGGERALNGPTCGQSFCRGRHPSRMLYESPTDGRPGETGPRKRARPHRLAA
jgi:hypothetical protein